MTKGNELKNDEFNQEIGRKLKLIKAQKHVSSTDMAKHLRVAKSTISNYEKGTHGIPLRTICDIARYLKIHVDELLPSEQWFKSNSRK